MIPLLPKWNLHSNRPTFYDMDAATMLELASTLHGSMNSVIEEYNQLADNVNKLIQEFVTASNGDYEIFKTAIRQEFQDFIDIIDVKYRDHDKTITDAFSDIETMVNTIVADYIGSGSVTVTDEEARAQIAELTPEKIGAEPATESTEFPGCYYRTVNGKIEWINPPFKLGVEYLTTERWDGKAVFAKMLDLGSLPANNTATYDGSLTTATKVHSMELLAYNSDYQYMPLAYDSGITSAIYNRGSAKFIIKTNTTYNNIVNVYLKVKYTDNR